LRIVKQILSICSHAILGGVFFLVAYLSAIIYFMSLVHPERECPGALDTPIAVNAEGDQIQMKSQACGFIPSVKTVSLYVRGKDGRKYGPFFAYMPDSAVPHVAWTAQHRIAVELASARNILHIGILGDFAVDYDIGQVRP
jgi:hypothetical protein